MFIYGALFQKKLNLKWEYGISNRGVENYISGITYFPYDRVMHFFKKDSDATASKSSSYVNKITLKGNKASDVRK